MDWQTYKNQYIESIKNPESFWGKQAERLSWYKKWSKVKDTSFHKPVRVRWFQEAKLNACYNCVDRHIPEKSSKIAIVWESDDPSTPSRKITYQDLKVEVNLMANVLKKHGVKKGDRVTIYLPMIPEAVFAMLACSRIGAIHSVIFGGFSPESISGRVNDCDSSLIITANEGVRGGKIIPLKKNIDEALKKTSSVKKVLVIKHTPHQIDFVKNRDLWWHEEKTTVTDGCEPEIMDSEDPLFILYTSGSTGKPKGVVHGTGGYLLFANTTFKHIFDYKEEDIFWCTADVGWVTGHSYLVYGPLSNGATVLMYEGVPNYPSHSRFWEIIDKHNVTIFYTAPTAIRSLISEGLEPLKKSSRKSLRLLGSVGEPINPEAWLWYFNSVGDKRCPIVDTWWQTETGGIMISPIPGAFELKPGSATFPFFGVTPKLLSPEGNEISGSGEGVLVIEDSWPGQMQTVYKDHGRFEETYFSAYPGYYFTGDGCKRDGDGYYWITGRVDDVLNVAGHRLGTAEIESALVSHKAVAEAAVVGFPHDIKGQGIYAFVTLKNGIPASDSLKKDLVIQVRKEISPIASPDVIQWAPSLPKTRSGKIMRRILRKIAENLPDQLGDVSTLADPNVVKHLLENRPPV